MTDTFICRYCGKERPWSDRDYDMGLALAERASFDALGHTESVMASIHPQYCELIANGKKTIEVRKTRPELETPFKCYIYCTGDSSGWRKSGCSSREEYSGKVIGEFVCDDIAGYRTCVGIPVHLCREGCLSSSEISKYARGDDVYSWHISNLKIYDKPKELKEFGLNRPPQSWCYVDELVA